MKKVILLFRREKRSFPSTTVDTNVAQSLEKSLSGPDSCHVSSKSLRETRRIEFTYCAYFRIVAARFLVD